MIRIWLLTRCCTPRWQSPPLFRQYRTKGSKNKKTLEKEEREKAIKIKRVALLPSAISTWQRPAIVSHGSEHHQDLHSFLAYAERQKLAKTSPTYQGTHYEYMAAARLAHLGFDVSRTGKTADLGIDLLGWWHLPKPSPLANSEPIRVFLQCKAYAAKIGPRFVRELEGSFIGAPAHWQGQGVMGFLVAMSEATRGMREAMIKSKLPIGFMQITREGRIVQMLWNQQASLWGLEGYGVTTKFGAKGGRRIRSKEEVALTWNGEVVEQKPQGA